MRRAKLDNVPPTHSPLACGVQERVTLRNQIDPCPRAALLNPDHLYDELGDFVKKWVRKAARKGNLSTCAGG